MSESTPAAPAAEAPKKEVPKHIFLVSYPKIVYLYPTWIASLVFVVLTALLRPVLLAFTLPLTIMTAGLFIFVVDGILLLLTDLLTGLEIAGFGWAILGSATLSFLGLGAQPPVPEWGAMIETGRGFLRPAPWISLAPGTMIALSVLATHLLGDGLRDALDPHFSHRVRRLEAM